MLYRPPAHIIAKNSEHKLVCIGGLGALGVGVMWVREERYHKDRQGYDTAPEQEVSEIDLRFAMRFKTEEEISGLPC